MEEEMEKESRMRKILDTFFIRKPIGFLVFLVLGVTIFIYASWKIKIPMYSTADTTENGTEWEKNSEKSLLEHIFLDGGNIQ